MSQINKFFTLIMATAKGETMYNNDSTGDSDSDSDGSGSGDDCDGSGSGDDCGYGSSSGDCGFVSKEGLDETIMSGETKDK